MVNQLLERAIKATQLFLAFLPDVGNTVIFNLGYGRLKIWRYSGNNLWVGFIFPYKKEPALDNLAHITIEQYTNIALDK